MECEYYRDSCELGGPTVMIRCISWFMCKILISVFLLCYKTEDALAYSDFVTDTLRPVTLPVFSDCALLDNLSCPHSIILAWRHL